MCVPGFSCGKPNGSGLGLAHARSVVEKVGGEMSIVSSTRGTSVTIKLKVCDAPKCFVRELNFFKNASIIIADDDETVHSLWESRFKGEP